METIASYTVAITNAGKKSVWGTGTSIKFKGTLYILTCLHVVEGEPVDENLRFIPKYNAPLEEVSKDIILRYPINNIKKSLPIKLPIVNRIVSDEDDHLALIRLDSSVADFKNFNFYEIEEDFKTPSIGSQVGMMGFSIEIARKVADLSPSVIGVGVFPYFDWSKIVDVKGNNLQNFDKERHFLIEYTKIETACDPHGLSGCAVWAHITPGSIWFPRLRLVGVETHSYQEAQVLKATKVERLLELLKCKK